jgi:hemerythrin superfamily protein
MFDKVVAAVTPLESDEERRAARDKARAAAGSNDWLSLILQHHVRIEAAFDAVRASHDAASAQSALKELATVLTGHSNAEESVIYPALAMIGEKSDASAGYTEQAAAKTQAAELETLDPSSQDFADKLAHLRGAVLHHMYEEESERFLELKQKASQADQVRLTQRFREEFERYVGGDAGWGSVSASTRAADLRPVPGAAH